MAATAKKSDWLVGQKEIMAELKISSREQLKRYVALGLPGALINGRWHVHRENLNVFLRRLSGTPLAKQLKKGVLEEKVEPLGDTQTVKQTTARGRH